MQSPVFISKVRQAPLAASSVIGRKEELQKIADTLDTGDDLLLLNGMGGVGKTTLAGFYMQRFAERYRHIAWISCSGDFRGDLVNQLNRQQIPNLPNTDNVPELFAAMLQSMDEMPGPNLIIADNLNTLAQIEDLAQHKRHFPRNWKMLVTARCNTGAFTEHAIGVLRQAEATELFERHYHLRAGDTEVQRDELLQKLGRHTLAVEFVAKTLSQLPSWNLARMLRHLNEKGLADLGTAALVAGSHSQDQRVLMEEYLSSIFEINLGAIGGKPRELLAQLAMFPAQPHPFSTLCQVLGCAEEAEQDLLGNTLNILKINGLLEDLELDGWYLHPLLQAVAGKKWPMDYDGVAPILKRVKNALDNWALPESLPLLPYAVSTFERLQFEDARLAGLCWSISDRYRDIGDFPNSKRFMEASNLLYILLNDERNKVATSGKLGELSLSYNDIGTALKYFEQCKETIEGLLNANPESSDLKSLLAVTYEKLGDILQMQYKIDDALNYFLKETKLFDELYESDLNSENLRQYLAISYGKLGECYLVQGEMEEALRYSEKFTKFIEGLFVNNTSSESLKTLLANSYCQLGDCFQAQGKVNEAIIYFTKYNHFFEELSRVNPYSERIGIGLGVSYIRLAQWHVAENNSVQALGYYQKGLALYEQWHAVTGRPDVGKWIENVRKSIADLE